MLVTAAAAFLEITFFTFAAGLPVPVGLAARLVGVAFFLDFWVGVGTFDGFYPALAIQWYFNNFLLIIKTTCDSLMICKTQGVFPELLENPGKKFHPKKYFPYPNDISGMTVEIPDKIESLNTGKSKISFGSVNPIFF